MTSADPLNSVKPDDTSTAERESASAPSSGVESLWWPGFQLALIAAILLLVGLGSYPLLDQDESRYGQIPREMLENNNWVVPRLYGEIYRDKPPMLYWQVMVSYMIFGRNEFAARLPVALAALAAVLAVFWLTARSVSIRAGWIAGLTLTTMLFSFAHGRYLVLDGLLGSYVLLAVVMVYANLPRPPSMAGTEASATDKTTNNAPIGRRTWWRSAIGYVFLGAATLVKGPVAGILFGMPFVLYYLWLYGFRFWQPQVWWRLFTEMHLWLGIPLTVAVALPWFLCIEQADPGFAYKFFIQQNLLRYSTNVYSRNQPFWYFVAVAIAGLFPWVVFLPGALSRFGRQGALKLLPVTRPLVACALLFAFFPIVFFSTSHSKLIPYIAPCFPWFAVLLGVYFDELIGMESEKPPRVAAKVLAVSAISIGIAPLFYFLAIRYQWLQVNVQLQWPALLCFSLPMLSLACWILTQRRSLTSRKLVAMTAGCMALFLGLASVSGFMQTLGLGLSHAALMERVDADQAGDPRPLFVFKRRDEQASFFFYATDWRQLQVRWGADGEAYHKQFEQDMLAAGRSRVLLKGKDLPRFQRLFSHCLEIQEMERIGNSVELAVVAKPEPDPPPADLHELDGIDP